jgi:hypothetical protein
MPYDYDMVVIGAGAAARCMVHIHRSRTRVDWANLKPHFKNEMRVSVCIACRFIRSIGQ